MAHHVLAPDVAGGFGDRTELDASVHPPLVRHLHHEVAGWSGDELLETFPCFLVSPRLAAALTSAGLTGLVIADAEGSPLPGTEGFVDPAVLAFRWLQPVGVPGVDDVAVTPDARLVVSDAALTVLQRHTLARCLVEPWRRTQDLRGGPW